MTDFDQEETFGMAILDSGCTKTVCGSAWFEGYLDTLTLSERNSVWSEVLPAKFGFGDGTIYNSERVYHIPVHIGNQAATLLTHVVDCSIPLLL